MVTGAIRTDLILSAEIMVIALNEVTDQGVRAAAHHPHRRRRSPHRRGVRRRRRRRQNGRRRPAAHPDRIPNRAAGRPRPGRRDAQIALSAFSGRDGRDALGGRPHIARRERPPRLAYPARLGSQRRGSGSPPCRVRRWRPGLVGQHRDVCADWIGRRSRSCRTHAPGVVRSARSLLPVDVTRRTRLLDRVFTAWLLRQLLTHLEHSGSTSARRDTVAPANSPCPL